MSAMKGLLTDPGFGDEPESADCWPGQCGGCGQDESACHCDDDLDAPVLRRREAVSDMADRIVDERKLFDGDDDLCPHGRFGGCWICDDRDPDQYD